MSHIPDVIREAVRHAAGNRCGYCLAHQDYVLGRLEIEHIIPTAAGGGDAESNLWLACRLCNLGDYLVAERALIEMADDLQRYAQGLEHLVEQRTAELQTANEQL